MGQAEGKKIEALIIDDDCDFFYLLSEILKEKNILTSQAENLVEAENLLKKNIPDLIFLDNRLPDGIGIDFIRSIKNSCPNSKIIAFSGDDTLSNQKKALREGALDFLSKPTTLQKINSVIDRLTVKNADIVE